MKRIKIIKIKNKTPKKKIKKKTYKDILSSKEEIKRILSRKMIKRYERNDDDFPFIKANLDANLEKSCDKECEVSVKNKDPINTIDINKDHDEIKVSENKNIEKESKSSEVINSSNETIPIMNSDKIKTNNPNISQNSLKSVFEISKPPKEKKSKLKNIAKKNNRTKKIKPITFYFPPCRKSLVNSKKELILRLKKILKKKNNNELNKFIKKMHRNNIIFVLNFLKVTNKNTKAPKNILDNILFNILTSNIKIKFN